MKRIKNGLRAVRSLCLIWIYQSSCTFRFNLVIFCEKISFRTSDFTILLAFECHIFHGKYFSVGTIAHFGTRYFSV